jgi:hypothetical protein
MSLVSHQVDSTYTPYIPERAVFISYALPPHLCAASTPLPPRTIYAELAGYVSFIPYPADVDAAMQDIANASAVKPPSFSAFVASTAGTDPLCASAVAPVEAPAAVTRVFIGQLPYLVTEMQLVWTCALFGGRIMSPQRILKSGRRGERLPTGGVHVLCQEANFLEMEQAMHKRVLIDDTGIWFAATLQEKTALDSFVAHLHANRQARVVGRPYDSVVVQRATSSFVPQQNVGFDRR